MTHSPHADPPADPPAEPLAEPPPEWLLPLSADAPCGPSLEYDAEFAMLQSRLRPRGDAQYGAFLDQPEPPPWAEVERDCRRLLMRARDIHLLVWLCRARTRLGQATGLAQSLSTMLRLLQAWPMHIHPQLSIDGQHEPAIRANALAALADPEGLLGDLRDITLAPATAARLSVRDVERAFAIPRAADAPALAPIQRQFAALRASPDRWAPVHQLAEAARHVRAIEDWAQAILGDQAPSLQALTRLLAPYAADAGTRAAPASSPAQPALRPMPPTRAAAATPAAPTPGDTPAPASRADALHALRTARDWFEAHEPSSPVPVLLRQAERMVGRRFCDIADTVPLDLLRRWDAEAAPGGSP